MLRLSLKIWLLGNLLVFALFALSLFPRGFSLGWEALRYSALFSAPAIGVIYLVLRFLEAARSTVLFSWIMLLLATGLVAFIAYSLSAQWPLSQENDTALTLALAFVSGYAAVIMCSSSLHYLFQKIQYGNEID
jgi:hypothetical protein